MPSPPPPPWRAWITALASRYKDDIQLWEIWNEPNISFASGTVGHYDEVQRVAFDAIKSVAPALPVTSGGYAGINHGKNKPGAFEAAFRSYPKSYDWFAYHMHDTFPNFFRDLHIRLPEVARRARADDVFPPLVFTETGFDTRFGQNFQAETLVKKMTFAAAIGAKSYTWYNLMDRAGRDTPQKAGHTFGLIANPTGTGDFASIESEIRPKKSFVAAATAIRLLRNARHLATWIQDGHQFAYLFQLAGKTHLLVAWTEDETTPDAFNIVRLNSPETTVTELDIWGNATACPVGQNMALVSLKPEPRYYLFHDSGTPPRLVGPLVDFPQHISPDAAGEVVMNVRLANPFDHPLSLKTPNPQKIPAGQTSGISVRQKIPQGAFGDSTELRIPLAFDDLQWAPQLRVPVIFNTLDATQKQHFAIKEIRHVTNRQDHDPHTLHLQWSGPTDLSAQGSIEVISPTGNSPGLRLEIEVVDNSNNPAPANAPILDGDAVEIGWASPAPDGFKGRLEIAADIGKSPRLAGHESAKKIVRQINIRRQAARNSWEGSRTIYSLELDVNSLRGPDYDPDKNPADIFRFNLAFHDNDGDGPKSWISLAPGLGGAGAFDPRNFPFLRIQKTATHVPLMEH